MTCWPRNHLRGIPYIGRCLIGVGGAGWAEGAPWAHTSMHTLLRGWLPYPTLLKLTGVSTPKYGKHDPPPIHTGHSGFSSHNYSNTFNSIFVLRSFSIVYPPVYEFYFAHPFLNTVFTSTLGQPPIHRIYGSQVVPMGPRFIYLVWGTLQVLSGVLKHVHTCEYSIKKMFG